MIHDLKYRRYDYCTKPKMREYIAEIEKNIAEALGLEKNQVNVKATTEEGLGFTGTGEGISSQAICAISSMYEHMSENLAQSGCGSCGGCSKQHN